MKLYGSAHAKRVKQIVDENKSKFETNNADIDRAIETYNEEGPLEDAWSFAAESEVQRMESIIEKQMSEDLHEPEFNEIPELSDNHNH